MVECLAHSRSFISYPTFLSPTPTGGGFVRDQTYRLSAKVVDSVDWLAGSVGFIYNSLIKPMRDISKALPFPLFHVQR